MHYSELWALDLETWRSEKLVDENRVIRELAVSPDESRIAMITTPTEELITNEGFSRVDVWDRAGDRVDTLPDAVWRDEACSPYGWLGGLAWSAGANRLAFRVDFDGYPGEVIVVRFAGRVTQAGRLARPGGF